MSTHVIYFETISSYQGLSSLLVPSQRTILISDVIALDWSVFQYSLNIFCSLFNLVGA